MTPLSDACDTQSPCRGRGISLDESGSMEPPGGSDFSRNQVEVRSDGVPQQPGSREGSRQKRNSFSPREKAGLRARTAEHDESCSSALSSGYVNTHPNRLTKRGPVSGTLRMPAHDAILTGFAVEPILRSHVGSHVFTVLDAVGQIETFPKTRTIQNAIEVHELPAVLRPSLSTTRLHDSGCLQLSFEPPQMSTHHAIATFIEHPPMIQHSRRECASINHRDDRAIDINPSPNFNSQQRSCCQ